MSVVQPIRSDTDCGRDALIEARAWAGSSGMGASVRFSTAHPASHSATTVNPHPLPAMSRRVFFIRHFCNMRPALIH